VECFGHDEVPGGYLARIAAPGPHLVDLRLSDVSPLLSLLQLMLNLPGLGQVGVGLLLLLGNSHCIRFQYDLPKVKSQPYL